MASLMEKVVIKSPWGNFLELRIGGRTFERSAMGNIWYRDFKMVGFYGCEALSLIARLLPASEVRPDEYSDMLRAQFPPEKLGWMK